MSKHQDIKKETIQKVFVKTFLDACRLRNPRPKTMESGQYSIPFLVGAAVIDGKIGPDQIMEERLSDPDILNIADKVEVIHASEFDDCFPKTAPSEVEIKTTSGQCH
jgi:2-methylcitrate dehydratase PrpD